jgi:hypothetical protein
MCSSRRPNPTAPVQSAGGMRLAVTLQFSGDNSQPDYSYLGDFTGDNQLYKDHTSSGIEGWLWRRSEPRPALGWHSAGTRLALDWHSSGSHPALN